MHSDQSIMWLLMQISRLQFVQGFHQMEQLQLHPGQIPVMMMVLRRPGISQRELADALYIKAPTVAVTIKRLEAVGYLTRTQDEKDQRISRIYLTEKGQDITDQIPILANQMEEQILQGFSQEEIILMRRLFRQIRDNLMTPEEMEKFESMRRTILQTQQGKD